MSDLNYRSYSQVSNVIVENETLVSPDNTYSDTLKFSRVTGAVVDGCDITSGHEDAIDINFNSHDIYIRNCTLRLHGTMGVTIKGGSYNVWLENVIIDGHGKETDIDLGNYSDQSQAKTRDITLHNVTSTSGQTVKVRTIWADKPLIIGGNVEVKRIFIAFAWLFIFLRKHNIIK